MGKVSYDKIARNGGIYDTAKYRYIIDTTTDEIKRTLISNLGTTAMLDKNVWEVVAPGPHTVEESQWYVVYSEHADEWFGFERPSPVSRDEIARLATEWDTPIDTLMEQVSDSARIVRINPDGSRDHTLSADYSTLNYSIPELFDIARAWEDEDGDGTQYVVEGC